MSTPELISSRANRWMACPGSARLEPRVPDPPPHQVTLEGRAAHEVVELIKDGTINSAEDMIDRQTKDGIVVDPDMAEHIHYFIRELTALAPNGDIFGHWHIEDSVPAIGREDRKARPDAWMFLGEELFIMDLKFGYGVVEPKMNWSLIDYMASLVQHYGLAPTAIHLIICQPRVAHPSGRTRWWNLTAEEAAWYRDELMKGVETAKTDDTVRTGVHCRYCKAMRGCPSGREAALAALEIAHQATLEEYDGYALAVELDLLDMAEKAIKERKNAIETLAVEKLKSGVQAPGWTLEPAYGNPKWNEGIDLDGLSKVFGVELFQKKPITPNQAKKKGVPVDNFYHRPQTGYKLRQTDVEARAQEIFG